MNFLQQIAIAHVCLVICIVVIGLWYHYKMRKI